MSGFLTLCNRYFCSRDFYEVLNIKRTANEKEIKKAYHKLSLLVHPDRVDEDKKVEATEKFKVLGKIHSILSDSNKRAVYDESGEFDECDLENDSAFDWGDYWRSLFKKITIEDIKNYEKDYIGSDTEFKDIKRAYLDGKGNMDHIFETVPFVNCDSEPRIMTMIKDLIERDEVPEYKSFTEEPKRKKDRRRKKWEREQAEAASVSDVELSKAIEENHEKRVKQMNDFFSDLEAKYGGKKLKKRKSIVNSPGNTPPAKRTRSKKSAK